MAQVDAAFRRIVTSVLNDGAVRQSRAGPTIGCFGLGLIVPMNDTFPLLTTRKIFTKGIVGELAAFLTGSKMLQTFKDFGCNYWDGNAAAWKRNEGREQLFHQVGRIYGTQWRAWNHEYDQIAALIAGLKADPYGRRHLLTTWNPSDLPEMCLPPCHLLAQFYVHNRRLSCLVYMRSVDLALGLPSDLVLYGLLQHLVARECDLALGTLQFTFGDCHIYQNHVDLLEEQLARDISRPSAVVTFQPKTSIFTFKPSDLEITGYEPDTAIAYPFNV